VAIRIVDDLWLEAARTLDIPVERGGDAYVHFDGRTLHIAGDEHLDADDSVAQLVLHEICHLLVQGPERRHTPDWGLDNTTNADELNELAAVRLQAHLLGAYGLRGVLYPTTVVRAFFDALPADALGRAEDAARDPSIAMARRAAERAGRWPFDPTLDDALAATAARLGVARHASGLPLPDARVSVGVCGACAWFDGRCVRTGVVVDESGGGCARWEPLLDCLDCGACCRSAYDAVPLESHDDDERFAIRHPALVIVDGGGRWIRRVPDGEHTRCAALDGADAGPYRCRVYDDRPRACSDLERGGDHCLTARRRVGLTV
jgi:hypothetical protein